MLRHTPELFQSGDKAYFNCNGEIIPVRIKSVSRHRDGHDLCICQMEGEYKDRDDVYFPAAALFRDHDQLVKAVKAAEEAETKEYAEQLKDINSLVEFLWANRNLDGGAEFAVKIRAKELLGLNLT